MSRGWIILIVVIVLSGCGGGGGSGAVFVPSSPSEPAPATLILAAGMEGVEPTADDDWAGDVDLDRLGWSGFDSAFDLTTPSGEPFAFELISRSEANQGIVRLSIAHARDGATTPGGGPGSLARAGMIPSASGTTSSGDWLDAHGDGFARFTVRGNIDRDHIIAVEANEGENRSRALVRVRIGPESGINAAAGSGGDYPGVTEEATVYSSDSFSFGLPTIAVSGDRTSIVCYEGDRADPRSYARFEMRMQVDHSSGDVTGGGSAEISPDSGHWRDHEIAGLHNVLALVGSGGDRTELRLSFDRGATFTQTERFGPATESHRPRLATLAMAADYSLAVLYWRSNENGTSDLVLVEGKPDAADGDGSPTSFDFAPERIVYHDAGDVSPLIMDAKWSRGGDLVIGYGFSRFTQLEDGSWESLTRNRCAVRPWGGKFTDTLVEEDRIIGKDPSVALTGSGEDLRIFFACEGREGVRLRVSDDAGRTFGSPLTVGDPGAHTPGIFARTTDSTTRVDLLYLAFAQEGQELHLVHWDDFDAGGPRQYRLTTAKMVESGTLPPDAGAPGAGAAFAPPDYGYRITQIAWMGYDAVIDGDDLVVVYDEETVDAWFICIGAPFFEGAMALEAFGADAAHGGFTAAEPPPLAPGMTKELPAPDPLQMHQLKLLRLE